MIEVHNLTKRYGGFVAVNHISFTARKGEIVGLLGPNGAGKTTTMRMLTGYLPPSEGSAKIAGYDIESDSMEARRNVGYMPERIPVYPDMTVHGYVKFWAELRGTPNAAARTDDILKRVQLYDRRSKLVRQLSKGMRQRLGLAQALVHNPAVIILDEPTIGIDPAQVIEVRETVRALGKDHTVLFSTHILSEAEQVCDRVLIINKGQIVAQGTPADLRAHMRGGSALYIEIIGANDEQIRTLIEKINGVQQMSKRGAGYVIDLKSGADVRAEISKRVSKAGYTLLEIRQERTTLEDVFLELTKSEEANRMGSPAGEST